MRAGERLGFAAPEPHFAAHHEGLAVHKPHVIAAEQFLPAAVIDGKRHHKFEPFAPGQNRAHRVKLRLGQRHGVEEQVAVGIRPGQIGRFVNVIDVDNRDFGLVRLRAQLQNLLGHAQRFGGCGHVVGGYAVIAPKLHRGHAVEHMARAHEKHVDILLFGKERAELAFRVVAPRDAVTKEQAADDGEDEQGDGKNAFHR